MRSLSNDRGAVTTLVAVLAASGVLMVMVLLVVQFGAISREHIKSANTAAVVALAVARDCARGPATTNCDSQGNAVGYADSLVATLRGANGVNITGVCGSAPLDACPPPSSAAWDCRVDPTVTTTANDPMGYVPPYLAWVRITTSVTTPNINGQFTTPECAQVAFGKVAEAPVLMPLVLPICQAFDIDSQSPVISDPQTNAQRDDTVNCTNANPNNANRRRLIIGDDGQTTLQGFSNFMIRLRWLQGFDCSTSQPISYGQVLSQQAVNVDPATLCGGAFQTILDSAIDNGTPWIIPMGGSMSSTTVTVASFSSFTPVGYLWRRAGPDPTRCAPGATCNWAACPNGNGNDCLIGYWGRGTFLPYAPGSVVTKQRVAKQPQASLPNTGVFTTQQLP